MPVNKEHDEFHELDLDSGWVTPAGYPAGIQQKILSGSLDENARRGTRTRLRCGTLSIRWPAPSWLRSMSRIRRHAARRYQA